MLLVLRAVAGFNGSLTLVVQPWFVLPARSGATMVVARSEWCNVNGMRKWCGGRCLLMLLDVVLMQLVAHGGDDGGLVAAVVVAGCVDMVAAWCNVSAVEKKIEDDGDDVSSFGWLGFVN